MNPEAVITDFKADEATGRVMAMVEDAVTDIKAGRKISSARLKALREASASMKAATKALDAIIEEVSDEKPPEKSSARKPKAAKAAPAAAKTTYEILL